MICRNYILIIIFKMASLLASMNRATTYFKESKSATTEASEMSEASATIETSGTNSEVSTDVDRGSSDDGMLTDDISAYEDTPKSQCSICRWYAYNEYYNFERQRCDACCMLTEEDETQCEECKEFKHITLYEYSSDSRCRQWVNAWRKVKKYCDSRNCTVQRGSWRDHLKSQKHRMNSHVDQPITSTD
jgi:hypothetical protein